MIRRTEANTCFLITQNEHARLSGALVGHFGNAHFARPIPLQDVIAGIAEHDSGWPIKDSHPLLNEQGQPQHVFETPAGDPLILQAWDASVDRAEARSVYSGLIVSLHVMHLSLRALSGTRANDDSVRHVRFKLNQLHHRQIERQENFRKILGMRTDLPLRFGLAETGRSSEEDQLIVNFHLLQAMDQISLNMCFDEVRFSKIEPVYPGPGLAAAALRITRSAANQWRIDPWPFDANHLSFAVKGKRVPAIRFVSVEALERQILDAPEQSIEVTIAS